MKCNGYNNEYKHAYIRMSRHPNINSKKIQKMQSLKQILNFIEHNATNSTSFRSLRDMMWVVIVLKRRARLLELLLSNFIRCPFSVRRPFFIRMLLFIHCKKIHPLCNFPSTPRFSICCTRFHSLWMKLYFGQNSFNSELISPKFLKFRLWIWAF